MKILFLDVDGVLNCGTTTERSPCGFKGVEPRLCAILRRVVTETGCCIVLSSTWRKHMDMLPYLWENLGAEVLAKYVGDTPIMEVPISGSQLFAARSRGEEITYWLINHPGVTQFAIVDDDLDMGHLLPHLVPTTHTIGITDEIADELIRRLNA